MKKHILFTFTFLCTSLIKALPQYYIIYNNEYVRYEFYNFDQLVFCYNLNLHKGSLVGLNIVIQTTDFLRQVMTGVLK